MSAHRVASESHHPHPGATRRSAPLHSARATNAAAYYLYLNVTRLLERWRTEEERIERDRAGVPRLHAPTHSPTSDLRSVNH